jgi:predicted Zn-dependent peptidase
MFKGSSNRTRVQLETEVENLGMQLNAYTSREHTVFHAQCFKKDTSKAVEILGDMISNSRFDKQSIEVERETITQELEETNKDFFETLMENVYFNTYREHMMGQPILGDLDNIKSITQDMVLDYYHRNYHGKNMVVVATGNVRHEDVVDMVEKNFGKIPQTTHLERLNQERPIYIPALQFLRDDEMINSNVGVFYDAPSWHDKDYYGFLLFQRIFGQFRLDENGTHLNEPNKQYSQMNAALGELVDVTRQDCVYSPYSDCGIFGNYFFGNECFTRQMTYLGLCMPTYYANFAHEVEIVRARAKLYNELLQIQSAQDVMQQIGPQILYLNRRVPRSEIAKRVSNIDGYHIRQLAYKWFYDAEPSVTAWGPIEGLTPFGSYKYYKQHTLTGIHNPHHALYY